MPDLFAIPRLLRGIGFQEKDLQDLKNRLLNNAIGGSFSMLVSNTKAACGKSLGTSYLWEFLQP